MVKLDKYPFKHMIAIVNAFSSGDKAVDLTDLRQATGACYLDTKEVLLLLEYLTSFGKITQKDNKWIRETPEEVIKINKPRKYHHLNEIAGIFELLGSGPKTLEELERETEIESKILDELLPFLSSITSAGYLSSKAII